MPKSSAPKSAAAVTKPPKVVTAAVLVIGNEILSGRTKDANLHYLAVELTAIGIRLMEARVVADIEGRIVEAVNALRADYDYVFTTGGIGPTHDDITAGSVATAFGVKLIKHAEAVRLLTERYGEANLTEARLRMAHVPDGATLIENPVSTAPGFRIGNVHVLAGVPAICQAMFQSLKSGLSRGDRVLSKTIGGYVGEGIIAHDLGALQQRYPDLDIGSYPFFREGKYGASFVIRGTEESAIGAAANELRDIIRKLGAEPIEGETEDR